MLKKSNLKSEAAESVRANVVILFLCVLKCPRAFHITTCKCRHSLSAALSGLFNPEATECSGRGL